MKLTILGKEREYTEGTTLLAISRDVAAEYAQTILLALVNGKLQELAPSFKTISGVSCISFTATHFSPYVIYVDTDNLNASVIIDSTPKTGDGIHPKWFLSVGLLCISIVLFLKKDKVAVNTKKARMA